MPITRQLRDLVFGLVLGMSAVGFRHGLDSLLGIDTYFLLSTLAVMLAAMLFRRVGAFACALAVVSTCTVFGMFDGFSLATFLITSCVIAVLIDRIRVSESRSLVSRQLLDIQAEHSSGLKRLLGGAVDAVANPLGIFELVRDKSGIIEDLRVLYINSAGAETNSKSGLTREQQTGRRLSEIAPHLRVLGLIDAYIRVFELGKPFETEIQVDSEDGETRWFHISAENVDATVVVQWRDTTVIRSQMNQLRVLELRSRSIVKATSSVTWRTTRVGRFVEPQVEWMNFTGQTAEQNQGVGWIEAIHSQDQIRVLEAWNKAANGSAPNDEWSVECRVRNDSGEYRDMMMTGVEVSHAMRTDTSSGESKIGSLSTSDSAMSEWVGVITDITDRKQVQTAAVDREKHLRGVLDNLFSFVGVLSPDGTLLYVNQAPLLAAGITLDDCVGKSLWNCHWWSSCESEQIRLREAVSRAALGEVVRYDCDVQMMGDSLMTIDFMLSPMRDEAGRITHLIPSGVDISDRMKAQRELAERERQFRAITETLPVFVWTASRDGLLDYFGSQISEFTGVAIDDLLGAKWTSVIHPEDLQSLQEKWDHSLATGLPYSTEFRLRNTDGAYRVVHARAVLAGDGPEKSRKWYGATIDVDDLKSAEARLRKMADTLETRVQERTRQLDERSRQLKGLVLDLADTETRERKRLAQILHDHFQQLISAAKLKAGMVRRRITEAEAVESITQIEQLLDQAITESRSLATELSPPVLHDAGLKAGFEWLARKMERDHGLEVVIHVDSNAEPEAESVRLVLFECVREMVFNVVKHAGVKRVTVDMRSKMDQLLSITVSDSGVGFELGPDLTAQRSDGSFGLFSIRERLSMLGGVLNIRSKPGTGTEVEIVIPVAMRLPESASGNRSLPVVNVIASGEMKRVRVLVADDHKMFREGLIALVGQEPYVTIVGEAGDGVQALALARSTSPDIVICDISMPKMNGIQVTSALKREMPMTRVIGLSMHERDDMAQAMRDAGAVAYCTKGGPTEALLTVLKSVASSVGTSMSGYQMGSSSGSSNGRHG